MLLYVPFSWQFQLILKQIQQIVVVVVEVVEYSSQLQMSWFLLSIIHLFLFRPV